ncbi:hypothetical protein AVEN_166723-1 [Araneus ventricosus]|uniref:Uncharacterized protein n=1 Tax=Araneus ventricosus TaxID=182803 RepID=A0A4Y2G0D4_ARAVE|nr:hypothetical protein AVEN_166723-1 [Araneus ventricosus]
MWSEPATKTHLVNRMPRDMMEYRCMERNYTQCTIICVHGGIINVICYRDKIWHSYSRKFRGQIIKNYFLMDDEHTLRGRALLITTLEPKIFVEWTSLQDLQINGLMDQPFLRLKSHRECLGLPRQTSCLSASTASTL